MTGSGEKKFIAGTVYSGCSAMILLEIGLLDLSGSSFMLTDTSDGYFAWKNCDFSYETGR